MSVWPWFYNDVSLNSSRKKLKRIGPEIRHRFSLLARYQIYLDCFKSQKQNRSRSIKICHYTRHWDMKECWCQSANNFQEFERFWGSYMINTVISKYAQTPTIHLSKKPYLWGEFEIPIESFSEICNAEEIKPAQDMKWQEYDMSLEHSQKHC